MKLKKKLKIVAYRLNVVKNNHEYGNKCGLHGNVSGFATLPLLQECERRCPQLRYRLRYMIAILRSGKWEGSFDVSLGYSYRQTIALCLQSL